MNESKLKMDLDNLVFDYYCYIEHMDFMTDEEIKVSSIFESLDYKYGGEFDACSNK